MDDLPVFFHWGDAKDSSGAVLSYGGGSSVSFPVPASAVPGWNGTSVDSMCGAQATGVFFGMRVTDQVRSNTRPPRLAAACRAACQRLWMHGLLLVG